MVCVCMLSRYSCVRLCEPMDYSLPGSSIHGFLQPRILEWITMPSSRGSSQPRDRTHVSYVYPHWKAGSLPLVPLGKPTSHGSKRNYAWTFFSLRKTGFKGIWEDEVEKHVHQNSVWPLWAYFCFSGGSVIKNPPAMQEIWVQSLGWRRKWKPSPVFLPGKSHGQRSLVSYKSMGLQKSWTWLSD